MISKLGYITALITAIGSICNADSVVCGNKEYFLDFSQKYVVQNINGHPDTYKPFTEYYMDNNERSKIGQCGHKFYTTNSSGVTFQMIFNSDCNLSTPKSLQIIKQPFALYEDVKTLSCIYVNDGSGV